MEFGAPMFGSIGRRHGDQAGEVVIHFTGFFFFASSQNVRIGVIAHPAPATASPGRLVDSTKWTASRTEARLALAVLTTERKAA